MFLEKGIGIDWRGSVQFKHLHSKMIRMYNFRINGLQILGIWGKIVNINSALHLASLNHIKITRGYYTFRYAM